MNFKLIVAMCKNRGIGYNNNLPWRIKEDLQHFSKLTTGEGNNAIIMGKNTWLSIGSKPLPNRDNLILSSSLKTENNDKIFNNIDKLLLHCKTQNYNTIWIIGGETIYKQFLEKKLIDQCIISYINYDFNCDTFFPELDTKWYLKSLHKMDTKKPYDIWIHTYNNNN